MWFPYLKPQDSVTLDTEAQKCCTTNRRREGPEGSSEVIPSLKIEGMEANDGNREQIVDVRSVVEAVQAEDGDAPVYQVESLCMRCGENVWSLNL